MKLLLPVNKSSSGPFYKHFILNFESPVFQRAFKCDAGGWHSGRRAFHTPLFLFIYMGEARIWWLEKITVKFLTSTSSKVLDTDTQEHQKRNEKGCPCLSEIIQYRDLGGFL